MFTMNLPSYLYSDKTTSTDSFWYTSPYLWVICISSTEYVTFRSSNGLETESFSAGLSEKEREKQKSRGERTCVTEMENDERITLLSGVRVMRKRSSNIFSLFFHRGPNTMTYAAQPDGDAYVGGKTCETLSYVPFTCGFRITKSRQFRQYKKKYTHTLWLWITWSVVLPV